jgi:hypothetical protein
MPIASGHAHELREFDGKQRAPEFDKSIHNLERLLA